MFKNLTISFCLIISFQVLSQDYKPLLDNINEWHFTTCYYGCLTDVYYTDGDTLVAGNNYKILDGFHFISRTFLLREDLLEEKVYLAIVNENNIDEKLLYDFSLTEGEEINLYNPISPFPADGGVFVLDSIRLRELVDTNMYRHYYLSPIPENTISTEPAVWVEGVGSLSLINAPGGDPDINNVGNLSCFFKNTELFYSNLDSIDVCEPIHLSIGDPIFNFNKPEVYVSESVSYLTNASKIKKVIVFDITGKLITEVINHENDEVSIDLSTYKKGIYLILTLNIYNGKQTFKVINK